MDSLDEIPQSNFHPSQFQQISGSNSFLSIDQLLAERNKGLVVSDIKNLKAPSTSFNLTPDIKMPLHSNTNSLFKNQFGQTLLTYLFFSDENVQQIQNVVKMLVYKYMNQVPDDQNKTELLIIMRSYYLEYGNETQLYDDSLPNNIKQNIIRQVQNEVKKLNDIVINYVTTNVISNLEQYLSYIQDISQPYGNRNIDIKPINTNIKGQRTMRSTLSVLLGGNF